MSIKKYSGSIAVSALMLILSALISLTVWAANTIPTEIEMPGTQQQEMGGYTGPDNCDNCHGGTVNPDFEPDFGWRGGMMANAGRDPLFWATLAIAEQDFIAGSDPATRGGAGDLCLRCHTVNGWMNGRSTPTDGSGLSSSADTNGVECEFCHLMVDPDEPTNISGTVEEQNPPYEAFDSSTGETYRGGAEYVLNSEGTRLGPYTDHAANHQVYPSAFHREAELCATCHDVSNPAVGDLAPNNGAQTPLDPGTYSGVPGTAVDEKAAFNNKPYKFGIVERTYSEWAAGSYDTIMVNDYPTALPSDLQVTGGSPYVTYHRAYDAESNANYEDGTVRYFTCQTCHMAASTGVGCNKNGVPSRTDLPRHDQTGSGYWMPDVIQYMDSQGTLLFGGGLTQKQKDALNAGKLRARNMIQSAAVLDAWQTDGSPYLTVKVTNLTGHKLISGYPEGRRMWINVKWLDSGSNIIGENGDYGNIGRTVSDNGGVSHDVKSLVDPSSTVVYEAEMGMDRAWADRLINDFGYGGIMAISYDRLTDAVEKTLADLAVEPDGTSYHSFHFVLNNVVMNDNRIPPYGFSYDEALERNCMPVPETRFGDPGPGGMFNYWDTVDFQIPDGAVAAQIRLYYQQTSWEYIQFLWLQNDGLNTFLQDEGQNMLDAWLNNNQCPPLEMDFIGVNNLTPPSSDPPGEASHQDIAAERMLASYDGTTGTISLTYTPACSASGHAVYFGNLGDIASYNYSDSYCEDNASGSISFTPARDAVFFVISGNNGTVEGSYGKDSSNAQRPEAGALSGCGWSQDLTGTCDSL